MVELDFFPTDKQLLLIDILREEQQHSSLLCLS